MKKKVTYFKLIDNKNIKLIKKDILKESTNNTTNNINTITKTDIINKNDIINKTTDKNDIINKNDISNSITKITNKTTNRINTIRTKKNISNNITGTFLNNIPFHKKILNTSITVDYFKLIVLDSSYNYLSHYHSDHYLGMNKKYKGRIVVSETTGNLIERNLLSNKKTKKEDNIQKEDNINIINDNLCVIKLKMYTWYKFTDHLVYLIDAKHCPGAVCFLFFTDRFYLHTGDFRCSEDWYKDIVFEWYVKDNIKYYFSEEEINLFYKFINQSNPYTNTINTNCNITNTNCNTTNNPLSYSNMNINCNITNIIFDKIYLDNTFENVKDFPSQKDTIIQIIKEIKRRKNTVIPLNYKYLFISYSVGKEKVFMSVCKYFNMKINVRKYKKNNLECLTDQSVKILEEEINKILNNKSKSDWWNELLTQDESEAYVISLSDLKIDRIIKLFNCKRVLVIFPTGWAKKNKIIKKDDYVVEILYFRYSEHSSHSELIRFKECMNGEIVNTVKNKWRGY